MDIRSKIILVSGPTASGKSRLAVFLAKRIRGEIINADSMQVYKELNILTARPSLKQKSKIKHHLYGFLSVKKKFSTGQWLKLALKKIKEIKKNNKTPILVGGTGLYFKALVDGLVKIPKISANKRKSIVNLQKKVGQINFYNKLIKIDPKVKHIVNPNDIQRCIRAYEVKWFTKKSLLDWYKDTKSPFLKDNFVKIYLDCPKELLLDRIKIRAQKMLPKAINEVRRFVNLRVPQSNSSTKIIGITEIKKLIDKKLNKDQTIELIVIKTRQYAKRQATWARGQMKNWKRVSALDTKFSLKKII